jgi:hypothetical protein
MRTAVLHPGSICHGVEQVTTRQTIGPTQLVELLQLP